MALPSVLGLSGLHLYFLFFLAQFLRLVVGVSLLAMSHAALASAVSAPTHLYSPENKAPISIGTKMLYLEDVSNTLDIEALLQAEQPWQEIHKSAPNFGFTSSPYWFQFEIDNLARTTEQVYVELPIPFLDSINLYQVINNSIRKKIEVGDQFEFSERPINHQNFVMPLFLEPGNNQILVRIATAGTVEAPLTVWPPEQFTYATANDRLLQGMWIGVISIMIIYNLFLFSLLRDKSYLYYVLFAFSYLMFQTSLKGYGFAYLWPNQVEWNSYAISVFIAASNFFAVVMVLSFLDFKKYSAAAYRYMKGASFIYGALLLLTFITPYTLSVRVNSGMAAVACLVSISAGYWSWYKGNAGARYFCLAWTAAFVGVAILLASKFGILPSTVWTSNSGEIGVLLLVSLLSFALASRFDIEKELRIKAQDSALEHEKQARKSQDALLKNRADANKRLEQKVTERTETLEQALQKLETVNEKLAIMSTTDALTELSNRGHFEQCLQKEFKRAIRNQRSLSVILCDIDHFKTVNDAYGHKAGDECLKTIANLFKSRIAREGDLSARYGGEEFILLLPETNLEQAREVANELCTKIREMPFMFAAKAIPLSASFGVSTLNSSGIFSADHLVTQADVALYEAKNTGRDKVVCWDPSRDGPEKQDTQTTA